MGMGSDVSGKRQFFVNHARKIIATTAMAAVLVAGTWFSLPQQSIAGGETRTLSLYHVHTRESLQVTYMVNGRYVPSAMSKINYLLRDWRRNEVIRIDPKTIDLMWELHEDLGSKAPIHIVCGYRSAKTNSFLKRIGRNVAKQSQHILGHAIDLYFPDVKTETMRNSALVRQVGGVGYYRSAGGPTGFLHIDSGHVRHWGPGISQSQMARIFRDYRKTIGARMNGNNKFVPSEVEVASNAPKSGANNVAYDGGDEDMDDDAAASTTPRVKPAAARVAANLVKGAPVPVPREKPIEVLMMAAADMQITPASAPPPRTNFNLEKKARPVADNNLGAVAAAETLVEEPSFDEPVSNKSAKGSFAGQVHVAQVRTAPLIKPLTASASAGGMFLSSADLVFDQGQSADPADAAKEAMEASQPQQFAMLTTTETVASGKGDLLVVNRSAKGSLLIDAPPALTKKKKIKTGALDSN